MAAAVPHTPLEGCDKFGAGAIEGEHDRAVVVFGLDCAAKAAREGQGISDPESLGRPGEGEPAALPEVADQQRLDLAAPRPRAEQAGGDHPGVVEDQQVALVQQAGQIADAAVVKSTPFGH